MPLSKEEITQIAKSSAQAVLEGLHRYTVAYKEPETIEQGLQDSMIEERTAADWYRKRSQHAALWVDATTEELYEQIAVEEDRHYDELNTRLQELADGAVTKEDWQLTQEEYLTVVGYKKSEGSRVRENWLGQHEGIVRVAIQNRKPVPAEVLKDYPDLLRSFDAHDH